MTPGALLAEHDDVEFAKFRRDRWWRMREALKEEIGGAFMSWVPVKRRIEKACGKMTK